MGPIRGLDATLGNMPRTAGVRAIATDADAEWIGKTALEGGSTDHRAPGY